MRFRAERVREREENLVGENYPDGPKKQKHHVLVFFSDQIVHSEAVKCLIYTVKLLGFFVWFEWDIIILSFCISVVLFSMSSGSKNNKHCLHVSYTRLGFTARLLLKEPIGNLNLEDSIGSLNITNLMCNL